MSKIVFMLLTLLFKCLFPTDKMVFVNTGFHKNINGLLDIMIEVLLMSIDLINIIIQEPEFVKLVKSCWKITKRGKIDLSIPK